MSEPPIITWVKKSCEKDICPIERGIRFQWPPDETIARIIRISEESNSQLWNHPPFDPSAVFCAHGSFQGLCFALTFDVCKNVSFYVYPEVKHKRVHKPALKALKNAIKNELESAEPQPYFYSAYETKFQYKQNVANDYKSPDFCLHSFNEYTHLSHHNDYLQVLKMCMTFMDIFGGCNDLYPIVLECLDNPAAYLIAFVHTLDNDDEQETHFMSIHRNFEDAKLWLAKVIYEPLSSNKRQKIYPQTRNEKILNSRREIQSQMSTYEFNTPNEWADLLLNASHYDPGKMTPDHEGFYDDDHDFRYVIYQFDFLGDSDYRKIFPDSNFIQPQDSPSFVIFKLPSDSPYWFQEAKQKLISLAAH
jgi:hypothetical protein